MNAAAIAGFLGLGTEPTATPFDAIHRIPAGHRATWSSVDADPRIVRADAEPLGDTVPLLGDAAVDHAVDLFERAVDIGVARAGDGPLCAAMSGGLDSTFAVASLARHADPERPVRAFVHVPHPDAGLGPLGNWDPDDLDPARAMETAYPGRVEVVPIANLDLVQPLDVAAAVAERSWTPVFNPANTVWIDAMRARAHDLGASVLFHGEHGNVVFSSGHPYALRHHLVRGQVGPTRQVWRAYRAEGLGAVAIARRFVVGPAVRTLQVNCRDVVRRSEPSVDPLAVPASLRPFDRRSYLAWLERDDRPLGTLQPEAGRADLFDPFTDAAVRAFARSLAPAEWERHGSNRGYARRLGVGRVPDDIRLRTRRGGQSWDHWFVIRHQRDRYLDELRSIPATPIVSDLIDATVLARIESEMTSWPWGRPGHAPMSLLPIERLLSVAAFVRSTNERLARIRIG
ncbi:MAG: hypothetical protein RLZZ01_1654 [Actinomycetota bacterium]